jgi:hypothetical protein
MSSATTGTKVSAATGKATSNSGAVAGKSRVRKVYEHEMTEQERFALQTVQRAQGALKTINDAIKSGKKVNPDVISLCFDLSKAAGEMLFAVS